MENLNDIIREATGGNTGGAVDPTPPNTAPSPLPLPEGPANTAGAGESPAPAAPEPFDEHFDTAHLSPEEQKAYRYWQGAYTKGRQADSDKQKELEARYAPYEGVPEEAVQIAREYANRLQSGDVTGARTLLAQQLEALDMLNQQQGYGYQEPIQYEQPDNDAQQDAYDAADPVIRRLDAIERRLLVNQATTEMGQLQAAIGRPLSKLEQQQMVAMKNANVNLSMEQVYYLTNRKAHEAGIAEAARADAIRRLTQANGTPPPPNGVPNREPVAGAPASDMRGIIQEAMKQHGF